MPSFRIISHLLHRLGTVREASFSFSVVSSLTSISSCPLYHQRALLSERHLNWHGSISLLAAECRVCYFCITFRFCLILLRLLLLCLNPPHRIRVIWFYCFAVLSSRSSSAFSVPVTGLLLLSSNATASATLAKILSLSCLPHLNCWLEIFAVIEPTSGCIPVSASLEFSAQTFVVFELLGWTASPPPFPTWTPSLHYWLWPHLHSASYK